jgi:hypothetical protein
MSLGKRLFCRTNLGDGGLKMLQVTNPLILRIVPFLIVVCLLALPVEAKYSGGTGEPDDPYQIATAADLIALGETPEDYDKHFILTADIDLDPNLPGRKVFDKAVIAPDADPNGPWSEFQGTPFSGVFDGNGHTISHLTAYPATEWRFPVGSPVAMFGCVAAEAEVRNLGVVDVKLPTGMTAIVGALVGNNCGTVVRCYSTGAVTGNQYAGGLVGFNGGTVTQCYSTGAVKGGSSVGGLVGFNSGSVTQCYSIGLVAGCQCGTVGGLVGENAGSVSKCYSSATVTLVFSTEYGAYCTGESGGLVGCNHEDASITWSFWDMGPSLSIGRSRCNNMGGTNVTTAEMQTAKTFLDAGWDFVDETANGTEDIWWILEGNDYPRLVWEPGQASYPQDRAVDVAQPLILGWRPGGLTRHDVYFGEDEDTVTNATVGTLGVYCDRQPAGVTTYDPGILRWDKTNPVRHGVCRGATALESGVRVS